MNKLIIGCGYVGRRVATQWLRDGHTVHALTRSPQRAEEFSAAGISPVIGDVTDRDSLKTLPECDTVLYAVGRDRTVETTMREVYVDGLTNVLAELPGNVKRFLYVSSTSVYGQSEGEWVDEESVCEPATENGRICREAELLLHREFPSANVLRLAGIYGPGRLLRRVAAVRAGEPVTGNPNAYLNLIHVDDIAQTVIGCENHGQAGRTYLVCDDRPITRREYYTSLAHALDAPNPAFPDESTSSGLNKRCRNSRLHQELQLGLQFPTIEVGLPHALRQDH